MRKKKQSDKQQMVQVTTFLREQMKIPVGSLDCADLLNLTPQKQVIALRSLIMSSLFMLTNAMTAKSWYFHEEKEYHPNGKLKRLFVKPMSRPDHKVRLEALDAARKLMEDINVALIEKEGVTAGTTGIDTQFLRKRREAQQTQSFPDEEKDGTDG